MLTFDVIAEAGRNPEVQQAVEKTANFVRDILFNALQRGQRLGVVDPDLDIRAACQLILALADGLCAQGSGRHEMAPEHMAASLKLLLQRFFRPANQRVTL